MATDGRGGSEGQIQQVVGNDVLIERLPGHPAAYLLAASGDSGAAWMEAATLTPVALHTRESAVGLHRAFAVAFQAVLASLNLQQV